MRMRILLSLALLTALAFPSVAFAACSNPAGVEGEIIVNSSFNAPAYCDDTNWIAMNGGILNSDYIPNGIRMGVSPNAGSIFNGPDLFDNTQTQFTYSAWFRRETFGSNQMIYSSTDNSYCVFEGLTNNFRCSLRNGAGTEVLFFNTTFAITDSDWHHIIVSIDLSDINNRHVYYDGAAASVNWGTYTVGGTINGNPAEIGDRNFSSASRKYNGDLADVWVDTSYIDLSVPANLAKFIDASGNPVYLGADGSLPTGTSPVIFLTGDAATWHINKGSGSDFTVGDPLTNATTSPYSPVTQIVPTGLVGHWRFDETSGTTAYDSSNTGVDLTYSGSLNPAAHSFYGKLGRAIDAYYNGTYRGSVGSNSVPLSIKQSDQITMAAWVKIAADNVGVEGVIRLPGLVEWNIKFSEIRFLFEPRGWTTSQIAWGPTIPRDEWTHIAVSYDYNLAPNTTPVWFVNGVQRPSMGWVTSTPTGPFNPTSNTNISIAASNYPGAIDDVRIYDRILNEDEVQQIYNARDGIRYNESMRKYEYFDGNKFVSLTPDWKNVDEGVSYDCPNIGDVCSDGSLFAGNASNGDRIYVTSTNLTQRTWKSSAGVDDISTDSSSDGRINVANLNSAITNFPAINECDTSTLHGQNDWYLPASGELVILNNNRAAIEANAANAFLGASAYWSSTESSTTTNAFRRYFDATTTNQIAKTATHQVRCIRRAPIQVTGSGGLVGHWKFDETTGTTVADSSGNGNNGTMTNGLDAANDSQPGAVSTSLAIDGIDDGINIGNPAELNNIFNGGATISGWAYIPSAASADSRLLDKNQGGVGDGWLLSTLDGSDTLSFDRRFSGSVGSWQSTTSFPRDQWFHYVLTYDDSSNANNPAFYINGTSSAITENVTPTGSADDDSGEVMYIANRQTGNRSLQGSIDDVRIYNRILSAAEIQQLYQMGAPVGSSTALPQGCPNVGDVCDDGSVYIGDYDNGSGSKKYFTTPANGPSLPINNGNSTGKVDASGGVSTGYTNTMNMVVVDSDTGVAGIQPHQAAQYCYDLNAHGSDDWFLPGRGEIINTLCLNQTSVPNGMTSIWSSSAGTAGNTNITYPTGSTTCSSGGVPHQNSNNVRCMRHGPAPRCANPYGLEGQMIYNSTHDVVQFCDGARWIAVGK